MSEKVKGEMLNVECSMLNVEWLGDRWLAAPSFNIQHSTFNIQHSSLYRAKGAR